MELITQHLCAANQMGLHGNLFGGILLSWIDESGFILAAKHCKSAQLVTLKLEELTFKKPLKEGNLALIYGQVEHIGNSSIRLYLEVRKKDVSNQTEEVVTFTWIVFVHVDPMTGKPQKITQHGNV
jgi:acyl-CoA thioesterase YciA